jgi:hypothetical protein
LYPQTDFWYSDNLVPQIVGIPTPTPPIVPIVPTVPASNVGATTDLNSANLTPATTTTTPTPSAPPPAGPTQPAAITEWIYCLPWPDYVFGLGLRNMGVTFSYGIPAGIGGVYYYGDTCILIKKTSTGYGVIEPNGSWFPLSSSTIQALQNQQYNVLGSVTLGSATAGSRVVGPIVLGGRGVGSIVRF